MWKRPEMGSAWHKEPRYSCPQGGLKLNFSEHGKRMRNLSLSTRAFSRHDKMGLDFWFILLSLSGLPSPFQVQPKYSFQNWWVCSILSCCFGEQLYITQVCTVDKPKNPEEMKPNAQGLPEWGVGEECGAWKGPRRNHNILSSGY